MRIDFIEKGAKFAPMFHPIISKIEKKLFNEATNVELCYKKQNEILSGIKSSTPLEEQYYWHNKLLRTRIRD